MAYNNNHLVIMAGGVGSRFWPMSTTEKPKQFIDVLGVGRSLLQLTFDRFKGICSPENVWVVTNRSYKDLVLEQLPEIPVTNILCEPCRRNTAPCIAYVSWRIKSKDRNANIVVTPSDHIVTNCEEFKRVISQCLKFTSEFEALRYDSFKLFAICNYMVAWCDNNIGITVFGFYSPTHVCYTWSSVASAWLT